VTTSTLFSVSYCILCMIIAAESILLLDAICDVANFISKYDKPSLKWFGLARGTAIPSMKHRLLDGSQNFQLEALRGKASALVFVSPEHLGSKHYSSLSIGVRVLWQRLNGNLMIVCTGTHDRCSGLVTDHVSGFPERNVIVDDAGLLVRYFRIIDTPQAVQLDNKATVEKYGKLETSQDTESTHTHVETLPANSSTKRTWPENRAMSGAGFARVDSEVACVLTRFRLRSPLGVIPLYFSFRAIRREAKYLSGLLDAVFLVQDFRTVYTLSLWRDDWSIVGFGGVRSHVRAANRAVSEVRSFPQANPRLKIWSAQFRLWAVSCHNVDWEGIDLQSLLGTEWRKRQDLADRLSGFHGTPNEPH